MPSLTSAGPAGSPPPIPLDSPRDRAFHAAVLLLCLVRTAALAMVCVELGRGVGSLIESGRLDLPLTSLLLWTILAALSDAGRILVENTGATAAQEDYQDRLLRHLFALGPARVSAERRGGLVALLSDGAGRIATYRQTYLASAIAGMCSPIIVLIVIGFWGDPVTCGWLCLALPVLPLIMGLFSHVTRGVSASSRKTRARLAARYLDALQGLESLTITGAAPRVSTELSELGERNRQKVMKVLASNQLILFIIDAGFYLAFITVAAVLSIARLGSGAITPTQAITTCLLSLLLLAPMGEIGGFFYVGMAGRANQRAFRAFLSTPLPEGNAASARGDASAPDRRAPELRLRGVSFSYPGAAETALSVLDMEVAPGEFLAITGRSGVGKSTLAHLLSGELRPSSGEILIGGEGASPSMMRDLSAVVAQRTWLFADSIRGNLSLSRPDASEEELWEALRQARLDEEVRSFPEGLDTRIGEGGAGLSGGQAQRLSLARALVSGRRLLILDEPSAHIDRDSEAALMDSLRDLRGSHTIVMVTHRTETLRSCDRVVRLSSEPGRPHSTSSTQEDTSC
ncbi:ATP-binding cassette domain-containing protein [Corynebacterium uropygiale]|uniref:ATP-binding cassette domain-containing protein n=1 Tax=Corynebacterium uropygiale TaxID=1775911 RepID=A0A9X1QST6_9CORY|nr:ATP-binding cassette domain-containing protein [Corynebacterium uropygiale]MCF4006375.1 ATP-binding cassette domain-containing protein [Corynebacterium uropygiale]